MASTFPLLVSVQDGIKRIVINRPERRNALDVETAERLRDAILEAADDESRVVVLTGIGESFCAGADLQAVAANADLASFDVTGFLREMTNPTILAMRALPKPIIARVEGAAAGVGCNLALASDVVIASENASFKQAYVKIGLVPDGGSTYFLPRLVGHQKAFELLAGGEPVSARDALSLGFVNRVVPHAALDGAVESLAHKLARSPQKVIAGIKRTLFESERAGLTAALELEAVLQGECFRSGDFSEGVKAFLEKRTPIFQ
jgi:2-(1,2-epoxy-1,2-dihydrophenyl)acetyl-CoA isomerase